MTSKDNSHIEIIRDAANVLANKRIDNRINITKSRVKIALKEIELINDDLNFIEKEIDYIDQQIRVYEYLKSKKHGTEIK